MSIHLMSKVWKHAPYKAEKLLVLLALADWANDDGYCFPSYDQIAVKTRITKQGAILIIENLVKDTAIEIAEPGNGRGNSHLYRLIPDNWPTIEKGKGGLPFKLEEKGKPRRPFRKRKGKPEHKQRVNEDEIKGQPELGHIRKNHHGNHHDKPSHTHHAASPRVCVSKFDEQTRRDFARHLASKKFIRNPDGYAISIADGQKDGLIQEWIDSQATQIVEVKPDPNCDYCEGLGMMRVKADGEPVKFDSSEDTKEVASCMCRKREGGNQ